MCNKLVVKMSLVIGGFALGMAASTVLEWGRHRVTAREMSSPDTSPDSEGAIEQKETPAPAATEKILRMPVDPKGHTAATYAKMPDAAVQAINERVERGVRYDGILYTQTTIAVLNAFIKYTHRQKNRGEASYKQLARAASVRSVSTLIRHARLLEEDLGFIVRETSHKRNPALNTVTAWSLHGVVRDIVCWAGRATMTHAMSHHDSCDESPSVTLHMVPQDSSHDSPEIETNKQTVRTEKVVVDKSFSPGDGTGARDPLDEWRAKHGDDVVEKMLAYADKQPGVDNPVGLTVWAFRSGSWRNCIKRAKRHVDDGSRYITGEYGKYVQH